MSCVSSARWKLSRSKQINELGLRMLYIRKLHGHQDIQLNFSTPHTILFADNGVGKTTALFILNCLLDGNISKIARFQFESIELAFEKESFVLMYDDVQSLPSSSMLLKLVNQSGMTHEAVANLALRTRHQPISQIRLEPEFRRLMQSTRQPTHIVFQRLRRISRHFDELEQNELQFDVQSTINKLHSFMSQFEALEVIYLPTYRRIEQEISLFSEDIDQSDSPLASIEFGMSDVEQNLSSLSESIREHVFRSYNRVSGQMLGQLVNNQKITKSQVDKITKSEEIDIILDRLEPFINERDSTKLKTQIKNGEIKNNPQLCHFLTKILDSYNDIRAIEQSIGDFVNICNSYLNNKKLVYDPKVSQVYLKSASIEDNMDLNMLSSGEKQLLGVMSKMYLGKNHAFIVIFDEPELSLSVEWQRKILVDIVSSPNCHSLIAATHSPFIIENDLAEYAGVIRSKYVS